MIEILLGLILLGLILVVRLLDKINSNFVRWANHDVRRRRP